MYILDILIIRFNLLRLRLAFCPVTARRFKRRAIASLLAAASALLGVSALVHAVRFTHG